MHPDVKSSLPSPATFEEVLFFNANYFKGIDWYFESFPPRSDGTILFEKSANYFDNPSVPERLKGLLPDADIVIMLMDPADRAYSWYQHIKAHNDPIALKNSFNDVLHFGPTNKWAWALRRRCLEGGLYAKHLINWIQHIDKNKIIFVDSARLRKNPAEVMKDIQKSLRFEKVVDYTDLLKYDESKGFFCEVLSNGKSKCLGLSKGRKYPEMDAKSRAYLNKFFLESNTLLHKQLLSLEVPIPDWLKKQKLL